MNVMKNYFTYTLALIYINSLILINYIFYPQLSIIRNFIHLTYNLEIQFILFYPNLSF
jgi:hypothetical protein